MKCSDSDTKSKVIRIIQIIHLNKHKGINKRKMKYTFAFDAINFELFNLNLAAQNSM